MRRAAAKLKSDVPAGDISDIISYLTQELTNDALTQSTPGEKSVSLWMNEKSAKNVESWMARNNLKDLNGQPAFISAYEAVCKALGLGNGSEPIEELSLGDLFWSCADAIFEQVPAAVPSFSVACILKIHQMETDSGSLPSFCNFLCKEEKTKVTVDESCTRYLSC